MKNRIISWLVVFSLLASLVPTMIIPTSAVQSGDETINWKDYYFVDESTIFSYAVDGGNLYFGNHPWDDEQTRSTEIAMFGNDSGVSDIVIPETIDGRTVTSIDMTFSNERAKTVKLPKSISSVGELCFSDWSNLEQIEVAEANPYLYSKDGVLLSGPEYPSLRVYPAAKTQSTYNIPSGVEYVDFLFGQASHLKIIGVPVSVKQVAVWDSIDNNFLTDLYYEGSENQWQKIINHEEIERLGIRIHFNSTIPTQGTDPNESDSENNADGAIEFNTHKYKLITEEMSWNDAEAYCISLGGHLVTITSAEENSFVQSLISKSTMIGLSDAAEEGTWEWVTGESITYTNWAKNEPNNQSNEDYALMQVKGTWNDGHLDREKWPFICEWDGTTLPDKTYSVEEIEQMVTDYFNANYQDANNPGKFVVFHGETSVKGNKCSIVVRFQSSSNSPNTTANVLFAYVSVNMETGVMTIEGVNGDTNVQLFNPSNTGDEPVVIPEAIDHLSTFNNYFVKNYYDNLNSMYQYDSVATDILSNSSSFQINWNSCLSALSNKEFLDVLKFENHPEYYYQTVLFESIMQTKLNDDYWSALTSQISQVSLDALSFYVKYDANFTSYEKILKQKLNTTMTDFSIDSVQYKRLSDYYGQYCNQLKTYDTVKDIYDLTVKADGTVEDFFDALSNYACIYNTTEEIVSAMEYLKLHLEGSTNQEDQYILTAVNNILASLDRTLNEQLVLNCLGTAKDLLWGVFWAAISDAFPGALALDIASFTIDSGLALSNVFFPTTISADSYCKLYADYAIEVVVREALKKAYTSYSTNPSDELATVTVGLYDLLGYTYTHEIEVATILSKQLHKDGLVNGLKNLFSSKNIDTYTYEQDCIKAYGAYLNEIISEKVEAQTSYGLEIGALQPVVTVYFVNGKVAAVNETTITTGDVFNVSSGEFPLPDFTGLRIEIEGYYLDQHFNNAYEEQAVYKPLSLYCNLLLTKASDGTPVLFDHSTGISVSSGESMAKHTLSTVSITSGNVYSSVEERFPNSNFELYDISLIENGLQVQPSGELTVEIPVNPNYANRNAKVYHVSANGEFEDMNATSADGVLQFNTTHFSYYVVVYENTDITLLIPIIIVIVVICTGVSLFFVLKSRKKRRA